MKKIFIKAIDPLIVDYRPGVSNEHETLDYIPASRLRGAFFEFRELLCPGLDIEALLGYGGPRWTHAWPTDEHGNHWYRTPKCPAQEPTSQEPDGTKPKGPSPIWFRDLDGIFSACSVRQETNMSVGRHYGRRANRGGALYARDAISPGQHFVAYVDYKHDLPPGPFKINIGTRHSANGLCEVSVSESTVDFWTSDSALGGNFPEVPNSAAIQLLSDAIVPAPAGGYLRGLGKVDFERFGGFQVDSLVSSYSASKTVSGWAGKWGLPRESAVAIEAGSVWLVTVKPAHVPDLNLFTQKCVTFGLGIRTYEGFGTVAVNPRWLSFDVKSLSCALTPETDAGSKESIHPPSWPESTGLSLELLNALIVSARTYAKVPEQSGELPSTERILKLRREAQDVRQWMTWIARNGNSPHEKLPGRSYFDKVNSDSKIKDHDLQSAQLFFLTVVESELIEAADQAGRVAAKSAPSVAHSPAEGGEE